MPVRGQHWAPTRHSCGSRNRGTADGAGCSCRNRRLPGRRSSPQGHTEPTVAWSESGPGRCYRPRGEIRGPCVGSSSLTASCQNVQTCLQRYIHPISTTAAPLSEKSQNFKKINLCPCIVFRIRFRLTKKKQPMSSQKLDQTVDCPACYSFLTIAVDTYSITYN